MYACPPMPPAPCAPEPPIRKHVIEPGSRYIREIGTAIIGNQLIIRMEREKGKSKKSKEWDPPCDCDLVVQRPTSKEGPKILKGPDNNRILFRVEEDAAKKNNTDCIPQGISYEVGQCKGGPNTNNQCRSFTIYPVLEGAGAEEVHTDRVTEGDENVFMLKVKKRPDSSDQPKRNIELELRTPRPPTPPLEELIAMQQKQERHVTLVEKDCTPEEKPKKKEEKKKKKKKK
ncbi:hypothetical protein WH47_04969 [Habropoda laboriosa]|uniref:Uncharacterized protein n=1 Tax=Habropoda laboriosa TaxID=597456 RepID=A0A0L7RJK8_9HYME|nr:PREDICTED: uncharacterized protein LOC108570508 [Habropoda laboriosa]KOC70983.1 hypothetical protein WH47_04969 [Habropoda laboriosa]